MSLFDRIAAVQQWRPEVFRPLYADGVCIGRVRDETARALADFPRVVTVRPDHVAINDGLGDVNARSRAVADVMAELVERGNAPRLRGEVYGVSETWDAPARLWLDRGVVPTLGVRSYGVHVNGYVAGAPEPLVWVGRRAPDKRVAPGKLDHLVAGGLAHGDSAAATVVREAEEEAGMAEDLARTARPVGSLAYRCEAEGGLRDDVLFIYDLDLPETFEPVNQDGELVGFERWNASAVLAELRAGDAFKFNVGPVLIDFLVRHGVIGPDTETGYPDLCHALHVG